MADTQREKAQKLVDADVMGLGATSQRTRKGINPVVQNNMSAQGPASPQPKLTPHERVFAKGGKVAKGKKAAQVAGMLAALSQAPAGAPAGAPPSGPPMGAPPMGAPPGPPMAGPPGMKRGGRYAKGGKVHDDEAQDKKLFGKMFKAEEKKEGPEKMKRGGHAKSKKNFGDAANEQAGEEAGESAGAEAGEGGMRRGGKYNKGGKCMKCGGKAHGGACKMATGGHLAPRNKVARQGFAMGGPGKMRKGEMTPAGLPTKPKRGSYDNLI